MKKVMFVLVALLVVSTFAFALESGPSNKVGYVKIICGHGGTSAWTAFGLPFKFWQVPTGNIPTYGSESRRPSSIIGAQMPCGSIQNADRIVQQVSGYIAYRSTALSCNWTGSLETDPAVLMDPARAYWYRNFSATDRNLVLAGEADTTAIGIPGVQVAFGGNTPYSWRDPRELPIANIGLLTQGFRGANLPNASDQVLAQSGGGQAYYLTTSPAHWAGGMTTVTPGTAYWIRSRHTGTWTYTYHADGTTLTMPGGTANIQKISAPPAVVHPAKTAGTAAN